MNKDLIQIKTADETEVQRRIDSFIRNKRNDIDERNVREFISPFGSDPEYSCARVEAVYVHREGMKSHINLKHVENHHGPQTRHQDADQDTPSWLKDADVQRAEAVEERLHNMELHLDVKNGGQSIFKRLKALEERISFLEGVSPEYFTNGIPRSRSSQQTKSKEEDEYKPLHPLQDNNLSDINKRIEQLKEILNSKKENRSFD